MCEYGYIRVSSREQNEDRQKIAMTDAGITAEHIYTDKQSGKDFNRPQYRRMVRRLKPGDLLCIHSIDRLGRNYEEILQQWRYLVKERGVDIFVLDMPLLDTRREKNLLGTFISDLVLQLLSFIAENERNAIRQRQAEGIAAAKNRGVKFGRPEIPLPENFDEMHRAWRAGEISMAEAAEACRMTPGTFYGKARRREDEKKEDRQKI